MPRSRSITSKTYSTMALAAVLQILLVLSSMLAALAWDPLPISTPHDDHALCDDTPPVDGHRAQLGDHARISRPSCQRLLPERRLLIAAAALVPSPRLAMLSPHSRYERARAVNGFSPSLPNNSRSLPLIL